jgi:recombination DNA repair RAD52 pathway protein
MTYLSEAQVQQLLRPIHPSRVSQRDGLSHLEAYDVRAHLNRIFGFGRWSADLCDLTMLYEHPCTMKNGKPGFAAGYRATMRLSICAPDGTVLATYTEAATGDGTMPESKRADAHDFAIKTAESQALKRCVTNLGDQFGLSLYQKGSRDPLVKRTLVGAEASTDPVDEHVLPVIPETVEEEQPPSSHATSPASSEPSENAPAAPPSTSPDEVLAQQAAEVQKLREAALACVAPEFTGSRQDAIIALGRINIEASRRHLAQEPIRRESGEEVTVSVFLDELLKRVSRSAA